VQTGAPGSKAFKGMPIPAAATIMASVVIFYYDFWTGVPDKNAFFPVITIVLSLLMVSTLRYHGVKEIDFRERKPFWALIIFVMVLFTLLIRPSTAIFIFAMAYLVWGLIENVFLFFKRRRMKREGQQAAAASSANPDATNADGGVKK
jgi:CDP-diacylglycerol--serine O-phosphatidyltransferase